jgi:hypothetical protein
MNRGTIALIVFLISLIAYSWLGFLLILLTLTSFTSPNYYPQTVAITSVIGAFLTAAYAYSLETEKR